MPVARKQNECFNVLRCQRFLVNIIEYDEIRVIFLHAVRRPRVDDLVGIGTDPPDLVRK